MSIQISARRYGSGCQFRRTIRKNLPAMFWTLSLLLAVAILAPQGSAKDPQTFKPFKLKTLDGTRKTLADYTNKLTLVAFFYPRCAYCKVALPEVQKIYDKYKDKGLSMIMINVVPQENKLIPKWLEEHSLTAPVLIGASQASLMRDYNLKATPTHYLLDDKGAVLLHQTGYNAGDEKLLEAKIVEALNIAP